MQVGKPGQARQVDQGALPSLSDVNLVRCAQMHRYFYQFIRKKVITMWRQVTLQPSDIPAAD